MIKPLNEVVTEPTIEASTYFSDESYTLLALSGYKYSGLQVYWPAINDISTANQATFLVIIPELINYPLSNICPYPTIIFKCTDK